MKIIMAAPVDVPDWIAMRTALWPHSRDRHADDVARLLTTSPGECVSLIARGSDGAALGFAEAGLRHDYVNGCRTSPVAFLEGIFVEPGARGKGIARALIAAIEDWARSLSVAELASDAAPDNGPSLAMHNALGFEETQRVVFFRKSLK